MAIVNEYVVIEADSRNLLRILDDNNHLEFLNLEIINSDGVNESGEAVQKYNLLFKIQSYSETKDSD